MELDFTGSESVSQMPQWTALKWLAPQIWHQKGAIALWLAGSLARQTGDCYSDIDFGVAVQPSALEAWRGLNMDLICDDQCVGHHLLRFGPEAFLHHLVLSDGTIVDLSVQSAATAPPQTQLVILGCRDGAYLTRFVSPSEAPPATSPADPAVIQQIIVDFWIGSHKHRKVLHRGLDLMAFTGLHMERNALMHLWYAQVTGYSAPANLTIHSLTDISRTLMGVMGSHPLETLGLPTTNRVEMIAAIEAHRDEVSQVGRILAERLGFIYPEDLDATVRQGWQKFLSKTGD